MSCDVDLSAAPYGVVVGDTSAGSANTAAINSAITDYSGKKARLVLPAGDVYVDQANGDDNWSIKFGAGVSDLGLVGHGMFSTRIIVEGDGDGGTWHGIMVDGASRVELADFGIQMGVVANPDPGNQNHLISILCSSGITRDVVGHHLFFGQAIGDGLRIFGDASPVTDIRFTDFVMRMAGIGGGARSGVAMQRGWRSVELGNFTIDGVRNSPIDMEPSGSGSMSHLNIHDGFIDQSMGESDVAFAIGGVSNGERAKHIVVSDVTVLEGRVMVISTDNLHVRNMTVLATARFPEPLFTVRQVNNDLRLEHLHLERGAGSDNGNVLDIENKGNSTTIDGGVFVEAASGQPMTFNGTGNLSIHAARIRYAGTAPGVRDGINVVGQGGNADNVHIGDAQVTSSTGKLRSAVRLAPRSGFSMANVRIRDVNSAGSATNGVYFSYHPSAIVDSSPLITGIDNGSDAAWKQVDHNDNPITTIHPVVAGNRGAGQTFAGVGQPAVVANVGDHYQRLDGSPGQAFYVKESQSGTALGWIAK